MVTSKLLLDENPLLIMPKLACKIGLNESIILQQIHYWNQINERTENNFKDGHYWTYNSYPEWQEQFPFWSITTIQRIFKNLEKLKLIKVSNYNKLNMDRTRWYRIDYDKLETLENQPLRQNDNMHIAKMTSPSCQVDMNIISTCYDHTVNMTSPIPKTTTKTTTKTNSKTNADKYICSSFEELTHFYQNHIKPLNDTDTQRLKRIFTEFGSESTQYAIKESKEEGKPYLTYIEILASQHKNKEVKNG